MREEIKYPKYHDDAFICPNCNVYSKQEWNDRRVNKDGQIYKLIRNLIFLFADVSIVDTYHFGILKNLLGH